MTTVSIVVPWRPDGGQRDRLWGWCRRWWEAHYSGWEIIECDSGDEPFTRGRSINRGVEKASGDVLVIADADTVSSGVDGAVTAVGAGQWSIAYESANYIALTREATERFLATNPADGLSVPAKADIRMQITSVSGVIAISRVGFDTVGGFPEGMVGWGHEDWAFLYAADTLIRPHWRARGYAIAPYHPHIEADRFEQPHIKANEEICRRYQAYYGNPSGMRTMIAGG